MTPQWAWLGRVPYDATAALQERLRQAVLAGDAPETLLLLEHDPVITLGSSADATHVLAAPPDLARRGVALAHTVRGGDVTYHGPGQLVGYPIVRLRGGIVGHVRAMADGLATVLAAHGVAARFDRAAPGLWVDSPDGGRPAKICAFGVHVRRRIAIHGFALNVTTDLDAFRLIVPCGLPDAPLTSMQRLDASPPSVKSLAEEVARAFTTTFGIAFQRVPAAVITAADPHAPAVADPIAP